MIRSTLSGGYNICKFCFLLLFYINYIFILLLAYLVSEYLIFKFSRIRNRLIAIIKKIWVESTLCFIGFYFNREIHIAYDRRTLKTQRTIIISNHLTNYDWIFIICILRKLGKFEDLFIVLKGNLQNIPIFGVGMKMFGYIFLERKYSKDKEVLVNRMLKINSLDSYNVLIFPEGTIYNRKSYDKYREYIKNKEEVIEKRLLNLEEVLLPRINGFKTIMETLGNRPDCLYDITIVTNPYERFPQNRLSIGKIVRNIETIDFMFRIDYIEINVKDKNQPDLEQVFLRKDILIRKYRNCFTTINRKYGLELFKEIRENDKYCIESLYMRPKNSWKYLLFSCGCYFILLSRYMKNIFYSELSLVDI